MSGHLSESLPKPRPPQVTHLAKWAVKGLKHLQDRCERNDWSGLPGWRTLKLNYKQKQSSTFVINRSLMVCELEKKTNCVDFCCCRAQLVFSTAFAWTCCRLRTPTHGLRHACTPSAHSCATNGENRSRSILFVQDEGRSGNLAWHFSSPPPLRVKVASITPAFCFFSLKPVCKIKLLQRRAIPPPL